LSFSLRTLMTTDDITPSVVDATHTCIEVAYMNTVLTMYDKLSGSQKSFLPDTPAVTVGRH